jgi:hypothetical protein
MKTGMIVARTFNIEEAKLIADKYEAQGYETEIIEKKQGHMSIYEVYASKEKEGFFARGLKTD